MLEALKTLFENNVVSEEVRESIESAWEARIDENREQVAQQLREEFAQKYEHDKQTTQRHYLGGWFGHALVPRDASRQQTADAGVRQTHDLLPFDHTHAERHT